MQIIFIIIGVFLIFVAVVLLYVLYKYVNDEWKRMTQIENEVRRLSQRLTDFEKWGGDD